MLDNSLKGLLRLQFFKEHYKAQEIVVNKKTNEVYCVRYTDKKQRDYFLSQLRFFLKIIVIKMNIKQRC